MAPPRENQTEIIPTPASPASSEDQQSPETRETTPVQSTIPPAVTPSFAQPGNQWEREREQVDDEWTMSDLGPPPHKKRRLWLWIIVALLAFFVLACCGLLFWISATDSGTQWFNDLATQVSEEATKAAQ